MGYMKYLEPSITTTINQMIRDGFNKIITIPLMLTESSYTEEIHGILEELGKGQEGIEILLTRPLFYKADSLAPMCAQLILNKGGDTPLDKVGVLLVSHGEPDEWVRLKLINTRCNEQETAFRRMIRRELITLGFKDANITDAFMEFVPPRITTAIEKIAHTVDRIIILPAFGQAESLHNTYDIPTKVRKAKVPSETNITWITSWALEPNLIRSLGDLYRDALQGRTYQSPEQ
jgi:protoheme ferro-lyase